MNKKTIDELEKEIDEQLINQSIVIEDDKNDKTLGEELFLITKEFNADENIHRFTNTARHEVFNMSLLGAIEEKPIYPTDIRPRYAFVKAFRKHHSLYKSTIKSSHAERFAEIVKSLLGFKAMLEYQHARTPEFEQENKLANKLRR